MSTHNGFGYSFFKQIFSFSFLHNSHETILLHICNKPKWVICWKINTIAIGGRGGGAEPIITQSSEMGLSMLNGDTDLVNSWKEYPNLDNSQRGHLFFFISPSSNFWTVPNCRFEFYDYLIKVCTQLIFMSLEMQMTLWPFWGEQTLEWYHVYPILKLEECFNVWVSTYKYFKYLVNTNCVVTFRSRYTGG